MVDIVSQVTRSRMMRAVKSKDTQPERRVRSMAHAMGLRFRLHRSDLPGTPDLVFPKRRLALFVHGCFWHRHSGCSKATTPHTNREFWEEKFKKNKERDSRKLVELREMGWRGAIIWECETQKPAEIERRLKEIFDLEMSSPKQL